MLRSAGIRSTQRLGLGDASGGVVATWPAELVAQARYLYDGKRGPRCSRRPAAGAGRSTAGGTRFLAASERATREVEETWREKEG